MTITIQTKETHLGSIWVYSEEPVEHLRDELQSLVSRVYPSETEVFAVMQVPHFFKFPDIYCKGTYFTRDVEKNPIIIT
jgi:hypothetical protein